MNKGRWMSGLILIVLGAVFLIVNLGIISWSFMFNIITLWPLLLIVIGVNVIFSRNYYVRAGAWILFLVALIGYSVVYDGHHYRHYTYKYSPNSVYSEGSTVLKDEQIVSADLELRLGGTELEVVSGKSEQLIDFQSNDKIAHRVQNSNSNTHAKVSVENSTREIIGKRRINQKIDLSLNPDIPWRIDAKIGAIAGKLDFRKIELEELKLDVGAGDLEVRFGAKAEHMSGEINAGASNIKLYIPNNIGVKINSQSALSNTNLKNLGWIKLGNEYMSPNYNEAEYKMDLEIKMGLGNLQVYYSK